MHLIYFLKQTFIGIANLYQTQNLKKEHFTTDVAF